MKEWISNNDITHNPWHGDYFLLKFCRARKFELPKVIEMFTNYMQYRKEFGLDTIIQVSTTFICFSYFIIIFDRTSISNKKLNCSHITQGVTVVSAKLEDLFISRDLDRLRNRRWGQLPLAVTIPWIWPTHTCQCGRNSTSRTRFFRNIFLRRVQPHSRNKSCILSLS